MQRFKNILLVLGPEQDEEMVLDKAVSLAHPNGARLTLFSVLKQPPGLQGYSESVTLHQQASAVTERREWLRGLMVSRQQKNTNVVFNVVEGTAFLEVIRQVLRDSHDLVITAAEEKKGIRRRLFGTTSMHLMRKCPCPVWVVKRAQTGPYARILAAVDPSAYDPERNTLNPLILQLASSMARKEAAELHIIYVWHLFNERYVSRHVSDRRIQEAKSNEKAQSKQRFDALLSQVDFTDLQPHLHLIEGDPEDRIPERVVEQGIDLLVMGTVCRTGITGFLIGNTAEEVLNQVDCSVLTVKPEGFVTPVALE